MTDLLLDLIEYLRGTGVVQGDGIDAFRDTAPDSPDTMCVLYEYQGSTPLPQIASVDRAIQFVARDKSATAAKNKARAMYASLTTDDGILVLPQRECFMLLRDPPFKIKVDSIGRVYYGFNTVCTTYEDN